MRLNELRGLLRSLSIYYGVPRQARRLHSFYSGLIAEGDLCFDVGSHVGNRMRAMLAAGGRVVALEPQPAFHRFLKLAYGRDKRIMLLSLAAGTAPGETTMLVSGNAPTVSSLSREWVDDVSRNDPTFSWVRWEREIRVQVTTLDELIGDYGMPAFIKIDVEGYEAQVLAGLSAAVRLVAFEYLHSTLERAERCMERLCVLGDYEFNYTVIEGHKFALDEWLPKNEMAAALRALPPSATSGDVYARLKGT